MSVASVPPQAKFLVIRRDNIGDLLCTTPLIRALRERYPQAWIGVLANTYNAPVLAGNPDIDVVYAYEKAKHRPAGSSFFAWLLGRIGLLRELRRQRIDYAILAAPGFQASALRFARFAGARHIIGYAQGQPGANRIDMPVALDTQQAHEVEATFHLLNALGMAGEPPSMRLSSHATELAAEVAAVRQGLGARITQARGPLIGLHISARKPQQRWPIARYAELARRLLADGASGVLLFWAPGATDDALHPGDDDKARELLHMLTDLPVAPVATERLEQLIAGLSLCDRVICSDGGAMHIAAALGKPIVCFFGNSSSTRWHPWGVPHVVLQKESQDVSDITIDEATVAYSMLMREIGATV